MTAYTRELVMFVITVFSLFLTAYQTKLLREALVAQTSSSLQARQVDVCAGLLSVVPAFHWHFLKFDEWKGTFDQGMNLGVWSTNSHEEPEASNMEKVLADAATTLRRVDAAVSELYPFASDDTQRQVTEVKSATLALLFAKADAPQPDDTIRSNLVAAIDDLARKCRSVMIGENLGMI